jgi:hypothetical protein
MLIVECERCSALIDLPLQKIALGRKSRRLGTRGRNLGTGCRPGPCGLCLH